MLFRSLHATWPVGVDGERLRPALEWRPLAARLFAEGECLALERLPAAEQPQAFLRAWCRLEARLKARGSGLAGLEAARRQAARAVALLEAAADRAELRVGGLGLQAGEQLWDLRLPEGYSGALACLGREGQGLAADLAEGPGGE
mgnify:CR=1 FL=1